MQRKFLEEVLSDIVGKSAISLIDLLYGKKNVNEFLIAKKLQLTINQTRNILYKLADAGLVSSTRKKDRRKGWYTYFWTLEVGKSYLLLAQILEKRIKSLQQETQLREKNRFYICQACHVEYNEEESLLQNFICPECGNVLALKDDSRVISDWKKQLVKFESDLKMVKEKIAEEQTLIEKKRSRMRKRELALKTKKKAKKQAKKPLQKKRAKPAKLAKKKQNKPRK